MPRKQCIFVVSILSILTDLWTKSLTSGEQTQYSKCRFLIAKATVLKLLYWIRLEMPVLDQSEDRLLPGLTNQECSRSRVPGTGLSGSAVSATGLSGFSDFSLSLSFYPYTYCLFTPSY